MIAQHPTTNPILNDPWSEPTEHWELDPTTNLATDKHKDGRRESTGRSMMPTNSTDKQAQLYTTASALFDMINNVRVHVKAWRDARYPRVSKRTKELLEAWASDQSLPMRPFFCQREAVETIIWLFEAQDDDALGIQGTLEGTNARFNDGIMRVAMKMATGSGKTAVMAMLMIWHAVNHTMPRDFLIIAPNLTVKERLQELRSEHPKYLLKKLTPTSLQPHLNRLNVTIENFQAFQKRDTLAVDGVGDTASGIERRLLRGTDEERWKETDEAMLGRLLKDLSPREPVVVINDEAHHCYRMNDPADAKKGSKDERDEKQRAQLWFNVLKVLDSQGRLDRAYDLSATPMFLDRPADAHTEHFPWIVSDYPLSDAIEAGLTKIPRLPVADDTEGGDAVYRDIYGNTPKKKLELSDLAHTVSDPLERLYEHYVEQGAPGYEHVGVIPVMIVVANTVANAETLYRWIAGYRDEKNDVYVPGNLPMFSNVKDDLSGFVDHPPTLLVHSQLGDADSAGAGEKRIARQQAEFFAPDAKNANEQLDAIRAVFNSVGRKGEPGERIRCVVSVQMLTEGWDAKTVTHIIGFRAFGSQLLCEQVTGRALRRTSLELNEDGRPDPEYANVFGVPYEFMRGTDAQQPITPPQQPYQVEPLPGREHLRITFPNLAGYAWTAPDTTLRLDPQKVEPYTVHNPMTPTETTAAGSVGEPVTFTYEEDRQNVVWQLAAKAMRLFDTPDTEEHGRRTLFGSMVGVVEDWLAHPSVKWPEGDEARLEWLLRDPHTETVPDAIAKACIADRGAAQLRPVFADQRDPMQRPFLDTDVAPFETTRRPVFPENLEDAAIRSELSRAPCDSNLEVAVARVLETHPDITAWARNFRLGWTIPWRDDETGQWSRYEPDFVARAQTGDSEPAVHLIIESKAERFEGPDSEAKSATVRERWIPAVQSVEGQGIWRYVYIREDADIHEAISREIAAAREETAHA